MEVDPHRIQIGDPIRRDATGVWHRATLGDRAYTLRILREDLGDSEQARPVFEQEVRRIEGLEHEALVRVHRVGRTGGRPWMLTDPIDGRRLVEVLEAEGPLDVAAARVLAGRLHDALRHLDERSQAHAAPWPDRWVEVDGAWRLPTFRDIRARDGLKNLKRRPDKDAAWTPPERAKEHPARLAPEPWIAWAVGTLLRVASGDAEAVRGAVARLCAEDPGRRPVGRPAVEAALAAEGGPTAGGGARVEAPVPRRRRGRRS